MKILMITNEYNNFFKFRYDLINFLINQKSSLKLSLLAKFDGYEKKFSSDEINKNNINISSRGLGIKSNISNFFSIIINIFRINPIVIITFTIKPNFFLCILKFFFRFKLIINITGLGEIFLNKNLSYRIIRFFFIKFLSQSNTIICQNEDDKKFLISKNSKLKNKIKLIPGSGIKILKFNFYHNEKINFLFVGRIIKEKGVVEFIQASKIISEKYKNIVQFTIIGQIYDKNKFNSHFFSLLKKSNIKYHGYKENILEYIKRSSCIVLPSYREGLSRFLLEGLSLGKPIITTNVPGCKQLVKNNKNGFLVNSKDVNSLVNAITSFIELSDKKKLQFAINSHKYSKFYSSDKVDNLYLKYINELI